MACLLCDRRTAHQQSIAQSDGRSALARSRIAIEPSQGARGGSKCWRNRRYRRFSLAWPGGRADSYSVSPSATRSGARPISSLRCMLRTYPTAASVTIHPARPSAVTDAYSELHPSLVALFKPSNRGSQTCLPQVYVRRACVSRDDARLKWVRVRVKHWETSSASLPHQYRTSHQQVKTPQSATTVMLALLALSYLHSWKPTPQLE